ncbi:MAG: Rne/Rng family ribonuclease, partial [Bryobacteraceae bacterium]
MTKELVIGSNRHETKVAILEDDKLVEVYFQRANEYSLAGSIHKGRVTRVLPGMQSAFVNLGLERDTFLYVSDFFEENEDVEPLDDKPARSGRRRYSERAASGRNVEARQPAAPTAAVPETEAAEIETEGLSSADVAADEAA